MNENTFNDSITQAGRQRGAQVKTPRPHDVDDFEHVPAVQNYIALHKYSVMLHKFCMDECSKDFMQ
jgi:hypothetical protein